VPIVPLYFAAERPTVERDGMLLMVDDDRFPLRPGEEPVMRSIRFRTLGCYPLTGAVESRPPRCRGDPGNAADHHQRAPGPRHRQGRGRRGHGSEEAAGVFLMSEADVIYKTDALIAEDIDAYLETHRNKTMLRFITCGSVDDGKSTLIGRLLYDPR
jgi:3'-phosphoadenosine 5'-phosphosulfate sulfotransferase (PAPS reductase)/FAD synthetase